MLREGGARVAGGLRGGVLESCCAADGGRKEKGRRKCRNVFSTWGVLGNRRDFVILGVIGRKIPRHLMSALQE